MGSKPLKSFETITTNVDVLIIGSGYTGLHASIQIARAGREVLVIDQENQAMVAVPEMEGK